MFTAQHRQTTHQRRPARRGVAVYYAVAIMAVMCACCSLAVDYGRLQLVKAELARAADSAARAACASVPADLSVARSLAVEYAARNSADGSPVLLDPAQDVSFGRFDPATKQFIALAGQDLATADAVRVVARRTSARGNATRLAFARVLGVAAADVSATSVAQLQGPGPVMNVVGLDFVRLSGTDRIDSYDSRLGTYAQTAGSAVNVAAGHEVAAGGSSVVAGNAYTGVGGTVSGNVSGRTGTLAKALDYPAVVAPAGARAIPAVSLGGGQSLTLSAGSYVCPSVWLSGNATLNIAGAVKLYVQGSVTINGNSDLFGSVVARSIAMNGTNTIHYDAALTKEPAGPRTIAIVQ